MCAVRLLLVVAASFALASPFAAAAAPKTVCTITVNSPDEKEAFRRHLAADDFRFVELVERGRPDWLESACRRGIRCDVLVISGHYDGGNEFFSDRLDVQEFLPVAELERVSCSDSCPGLLSSLKEVYLFGCNTLNPHALRRVTAEIARSLVREGQSPAEATRLARALEARHGESSRDRMRQIFKGVPAIYGFSSVAPLGPLAASTLHRYFQAAGAGDIGSGRANGRLLAQFAAYPMVATRGYTDADPHADVRRDVCRFADDRLSDAAKLDFVHSLLQRQTAEVRMFLDRIERYAATLDDQDRQSPDIATALADIAGDHAARERYLVFARDADAPAVRARMLALAGNLWWLSHEERREELVRMMDEVLSRDVVDAAEVDLACTLNHDHDLDGASHRLGRQAGSDGSVAHAAVQACLGNTAGRARTLEGLVSPVEADVRIAQTYLRHRPLADATELRDVTRSIVRMSESDAQVRALEALGRHRLSDGPSLEALVRLYSTAQSPKVQLAVAGVLIRADHASLDRAALARTLRDTRLGPPAGDDMIDALIRRMQAD